MKTGRSSNTFSNSRCYWNRLRVSIPCSPIHPDSSRYIDTHPGAICYNDEMILTRYGGQRRPGHRQPVTPRQLKERATGAAGEYSELESLLKDESSNNVEIGFLTRRQLWDIMDMYNVGPRELALILRRVDSRSLRRWCQRTGDPDDLTGVPDYKVEWIERTFNRSA